MMRRGRPWPVGIRLRLLAACVLCTGAAWGQAPPQTPASAPYQDRVLADAPPEPDAAEPGPVYDSSGWPRYLRLETRLGTEPFDARRRVRGGLAGQAMIETPNHGTISLDGSLLPADDDRRGSGTLSVRQRGMPLAGGWQASHDLGLLDRPAPDVTRLPSRLYVPSAPMRGVAGEWEQPDQGLQLMAAHGEPGVLLGLPTSRFEPLPGTRSMFGGQWSQATAATGPAPRGWTLAAQHEQAQRVATQPDVLPTERLDARSTHLVLRLDGDERRAQVQAVHSASSISPKARRGVWAEIEFDDGPRRHAIGAYRLDPELRWAGLPLPADLEGMSYRGSWRTRQWSAEGSIDALRSASGTGGSGIYTTGSARWRLARDHQAGAGFALRRLDGAAWSAYGDWRWQHATGTTATRLELAGGDDTPRSHKFILDREWAMPLGTTLSTSLGLGHEAADAARGLAAHTLWTAALVGSAPLGPLANLRATLGAEQGSLGQRSVNANLGGQWRFHPGWTLEGQFTRNIGRTPQGTSLDPLAPRPTAPITTSDRTFQLVLRYEWQAGSRVAPLGGRGAQGGGRIQGVVFFDTNRNGTREASEAGVPGVLVVLDNRFSTRTDEQGRYDFPFVAAGSRSVAVRNDSLPLPWSAADDGPVRLEVTVRGSSELNLAVQRAP